MGKAETLVFCWFTVYLCAFSGIRWQLWFSDLALYQQCSEEFFPVPLNFITGVRLKEQELTRGLVRMMKSDGCVILFKSFF